MKQFARQGLALVAAALATGAVASLVQTHINLRELAALGAVITPSLRGWTFLQDLAGFGPVMSAIALVALLPAVLAAHALLRFVAPGWRAPLFAVAALTGLWTAFWLMLHVIPMPAIAATRGPLDQLAMACTGIVGGLVYAALSKPARQSRHDALAAVLLALLPVTLFFASTPGAIVHPAPVDPSTYRVQTVAAGLDRPWSLVFLPDGRMLVTEMGGRLLAIGTDGVRRPIALDGVPPLFQRGGTAGLMDVALDPDFARNGLLYLSMGYDAPDANGTRLVRARMAGDRLVEFRVLFSSTPKPRVGNNGGRIAFLRDGTLVMSVGDGNWQREEAQNLANHLGSVVRLNREGRVPRDNPYINRPGAAPELYSIGHRNPQGLAVDSVNGQLLLTEHGARGGDEINAIVAGANYGWPLATGGIDYPFGRVTPFRQLTGMVAPLLEWTPSIAPAGLAVVDGPLFVGWRGDLLVPALKARALYLVRRDGQRIVGQQTLLADMKERIRDVKLGPDGAIYVLTDGVNASLLRITPS